MNKILLLIFFLICINLTGCTDKTNTKGNQKTIAYKGDLKMNISEIKRQLNLQQYVESDELEFDNPYTLSKIDFDIEKNLIYTEIVKMGFKPISNEKFHNKIEEVFKISSGTKSICTYRDSSIIVYFGNLMDGDIQTLKANIYELSSITQNLLFVEKKNILLEMLLIKDFIMIDEEKSSYKVDVPSYIFHRNKYLFNDSKASLTWLKNNDQSFLESLVKTFGYVDDKDLLQWVINQTFSNKDNKEEDYNSLFFMKNCSNQFVFHKATFDVLKEKIDSTSMAALQNYINNRERNQELQNLPFAQKAQVLAYALYIGEFFAQQEQYSNRFAFKFMGTFYEYEDQRDKYDEEFKNNNYYNLPDFEQLWKDGKEYGDGIGLPM